MNLKTMIWEINGGIAWNSVAWPERDNLNSMARPQRELSTSCLSLETTCVCLDVYHHLWHTVIEVNVIKPLATKLHDIFSILVAGWHLT